MNFFRNRLLLLICITSVLLLTNAFTTFPNDENLKTKALHTLEKATAYMESISTEGGYLWRYSLDFKTVAGETLASPTQIWVQDGTPEMGDLFLKLYKTTRNSRYLEDAQNAAMALRKGQLESGGWDYMIEFDPEKRKRYNYRVDEHSNTAKLMNRTTYDDHNTQSALSFLLSFLEVKENEDIRETVEYGLDKIVEAQYPIGAWPQRWDGDQYDPAKFPVKQATIPANYPREQPDGSYYHHYTFNDNAHRDMVMVLMQGWHETHNEKYLEAAKKGADFLLYSQLPEPQPVWAQQYNSDMEPAWARAFEPPSATAGESTGVLRMLVDMYLELGDEKYLEPIPRAIKWFERSEIRPNTWARMYELTTNRPIYGDRDKKIHYTLEEISDERKNGYAWEGSFGVKGAINYYESVKLTGRKKWLDSMETKLKLGEGQQKALETQVNEVIQSLDDQNRWIYKGHSRRLDSDVDEWITVALYKRNVDILCQYLTSIEN